MLRILQREQNQKQTIMEKSIKGTRTEQNLLKAFAGESQARSRYTFFASKAKKEGYEQVAAVFLETADQEKEHAEIFYNHMKELAGETVHIDGGYPVDITNDILQLLRRAQHNEFEEHDPVYRDFADTAQREGFPKIASSFRQIAEIEKTHGSRFAYLADLLEQGRLFSNQGKTAWMCLNCGYIFEGEKVPEKCPVCDHDKGYFIRVSLAPFTDGQKAWA